MTTKLRVSCGALRQVSCGDSLPPAAPLAVHEFCPLLPGMVLIMLSGSVPPSLKVALCSVIW